MTLASGLQTELHADIWQIMSHPWAQYELDSFENSISAVVDSSPASRAIRLSRAGLWRASRFSPRSIRLNNWVQEKRRGYDSSMRRVRDGDRILGYFQSWKYFSSARDLLKKETANVRDPASWYKEAINDLRSRGPWICLHIRRGDYLTNKKMMALDLEYYSRARSMLDLGGQEVPTVIFTDDEEFRVPNEWPFSDTCEIYSTPRVARPIEVLNLMSLASYVLIANSTFSWWAAYLSEASPSNVVAPTPWLPQIGFSGEDLLMPGWRRSPSSWIAPRRNKGRESPG